MPRIHLVWEAAAIKVTLPGMLVARVANVLEPLLVSTLKPLKRCSCPRTAIQPPALLTADVPPAILDVHWQLVHATANVREAVARCPSALTTANVREAVARCPSALTTVSAMEEDNVICLPALVVANVLAEGVIFQVSKKSS